MKRKPRGYWTKERCAAKAKQCQTRGLFYKNFRSAYSVAWQQGWLDDICRHMTTKESKPANYWTKKRCAEEAAKYQTRSAFQNCSSSAYQTALRKKWLDDMCGHMVPGVHGVRKWTKERCAEEAEKYQTRSAFAAGSTGCYISARVAGWLEEVCRHMAPPASFDDDQSRDVYAIVSTVPDSKECYIGLSVDTERRMEGHLANGRARVQSLLAGDHVVLLLDRNIPNAVAAQQSERRWLKRFIADGWNTLNKAKPGSLGGMIRKWTKKRCAEEAAKYRTRSAFQNGSSSAYQTALRKKWLDDICGHMIRLQKANNYWNRSRCGEEAAKYQTRTAFQKACGSAYNRAVASGWLDEICAHMPTMQKPPGHWTKSRCAEEAAKCHTRTEFARACGGAYATALREGWVDDICGHMSVKVKRWTKTQCQKAALKFQTRVAFQKGASGAYQFAKRRNWLDSICQHMKPLRNPDWTKKRCAEEALKYKTRSSFQRGAPGAYLRAMRSGWLDDICGHMDSGLGRNRKWSKQRCAEEAEKYQTRSAFKAASSAYQSARRKGWLDEICDHMD